MNWEKTRYWKKKGAKIEIIYLEDEHYCDLEIGDTLYLFEKYSNGEITGWSFTSNPNDETCAMDDNDDTAFLLDEEYERCED